jgi:LEA14-like dessication related protein
MKPERKRGWLVWPVLLLVLGAAGWLLMRNKESENGPGASGGIKENALHAAKGKAAKMAMEVVSSSITDISNDKIQVMSKVRLNNPLPLPLHASRLDYTMMAGKTKVAEGSYTKPIKLPANSDTTLALPMQILVPAMAKIIKEADAQQRDSILYTFYNTIYTDVPVAGETKIPFNIKATLPVVRLPELSPGDLDIDKLGLKNAAMDMVMHVKNRNPFTLRMSGGRYSMTIDGQHTVNGSMQKEVVLPAKQTTPITMHMDMKTGKALKMGWKMLFDKKDTRYALTFDSKLASEHKLLQNSRMHFTDEGNLADLVKTVKKAK